MPNLKRTLLPDFIALTSVTALFLSFHTSIAADSATVTATVTAQNVSVTVSDGSVAYGTLAASSTEDTTSNGVNDSQTATNNGNVTEDLNIRGANSTSSGSGWTLGATAGSEQYFHKFCISTCDTSPTWTALTTNNQTLKEDTAASGTQEFDLQIGTPSSTTDFSEQSVVVTVQASAS